MKPSELLKIKSHQIEMMILRGYTIESSEKDVLRMKSSEFINYLQGLETFVTIGHVLNKVYEGKGVPLTLVCYVKADDNDTIKGDDLKKYVSSVVEPAPKDVIIVALNKIKSAKQLFKEYTDHNITVFTSTELITNPTKHKFAEVVIRKFTEAEKLKEFEVIPADKREELAYDDPIVKFYGFVPGDLILCYRRNLDPASMIDGYNVKKVVSSNSIYLLETNV